MIHNYIGFNFKFNDILASLALNQLKKIDDLMLKKKYIYNFYCKKLKDLVFCINPNNSYLPWVVEISSNDKINNLKKNKIGFSKLWPPLHMQKAMKNYVNHKKDFFPNASYLYKNNLWIPSSTKLNKRKLNYICKSLLEKK